MRGAKGTRQWQPWAISIAIVAVAWWVTLFATGGGLFMEQRDGPVYLSSAIGLSTGAGYQTPFGDPGKPIDFENTSSPTTDFPPGYSAVLVLGITAGGESEEVVRWTAVVLLATTSLSVFWFALSRSSRLSIAVIAALAAMGLALPWAVTPAAEILYGPLLVASVGFAGSFLRSGGDRHWLLAAVFAALATTVRTAGLALVGTIVVIGLLVPKTPLRKLVVATTSAVIGIAPFFLFTSTGTRVVAWHPPDLESLRILTRSVTRWLVPPTVPTAIGVVAVLLIVAGATWLIWRGSPDDEGSSAPRSLTWLPGVLSGVAHISLVLLTRALFDAQTELDARQMFPVALSFLIAGLEYSVGAPRSERAKRVLTGLTVLLVLASLTATLASVDRIARLRDGDLRFNSAEFKTSDSTRFLVDRVPGNLVFSSLPDALWVAGLDHARPLPVAVDPLSLRENEALAEELDQLEELVEDDAVLHVYRDRRDYLVGEEPLREIAPCVVMDDGSAVILTSPDSRWCPNN